MKLCNLIPLCLLAISQSVFAGKVVIRGSNTFGEELGPALIKAFQEERKDITIELTSEGSGAGITALLNGDCDIAASSRSLSEDEMRMASSRKIKLRNYTIGYYGVAVVVNPQNPVKKLSSGQVRAIFTGKITNWKQVGGKDGPIHVIIRDPVSGTHLGFQELAMERQPYTDKAKTFTSYQAMAEAIRNDPGAIGYVGMTLAAREGVRALAINGVEPSADTVTEQLYPYARQLRLYVNKARYSDGAAAFIGFVRSAKKGQSILEKLGYVRRAHLKPVSGGEPY